MSRKKLLIPLNLTKNPPLIDASKVQGKITQEEFESFWNSLNLQVQMLESQHRLVRILNTIVSALLCIALFLSVCGVFGGTLIIGSVLLMHLALFYVILNISTKRNLKKRVLFLERENKTKWKPRGFRWSIEKNEENPSGETLVLSEDNEIVLNLHLNDTEDEYKPDECKPDATDDAQKQNYGALSDLSMENKETD